MFKIIIVGIFVSLVVYTIYTQTKNDKANIGTQNGMKTAESDIDRDADQCNFNQQLSNTIWKLPNEMKIKITSDKNVLDDSNSNPFGKIASGPQMTEEGCTGAFVNEASKSVPFKISMSSDTKEIEVTIDASTKWTWTYVDTFTE